MMSDELTMKKTLLSAAMASALALSANSGFADLMDDEQIFYEDQSTFNAVDDALQDGWNWNFLGDSAIQSDTDTDTDTDTNTDTLPIAQTLKYTYDALGRLTFVEDNLNGNRDYDYDPAGNRVAVVVGSDDDGGGDVIIIPKCIDVIDSPPVYSCSPNEDWPYGEYQYCTTIASTYGCVW